MLCSALFLWDGCLTECAIEGRVVGLRNALRFCLHGHQPCQLRAATDICLTPTAAPGGCLTG